MSPEVTRDIGWVAAGVLVFLVFVLVSRFVARLIADQLHKRHIPTGMVTTGRRVVTVVLLVIGIWAGFGIATQTANVTLVGVLLATVVAALGVQQLLQDYVSGYYVLLERHIRAGDRIQIDSLDGTVMEIKLRVTLLRTDEGSLAVIPNSELFTKPVVVYTKKIEESEAPPPPKPEPPA